MTEVTFHDIGEGMTEAEVLRLYVEPGDDVVNDQPLLEVQTDKMTAEIPSPSAGTVTEIRAAIGDNIEVGQVIMTLSGADSAEDHQQNNAASEVTEASQADSVNHSADVSSPMGRQQGNQKPLRRVLAAPYTRKVARDHEIDIEKIQGTGTDGRVTEADVYEAVSLEQPDVQDPVASPAARKRAREQGIDLHDVHTYDPLGRIRVDDVTQQHSRNIRKDKRTEEIPFKGRRRMIAGKMSHALHTIPHVAHFDEVDVTHLYELKQSLQATHPEKNASMAAFFLKALQKALTEVPIFNAKLDEENEVIQLEKTYNMGIAVDTDEGLIVPVIHHVEDLTINDVHSKMKDAIDKAKKNQLKAAELSGGTFTMSNVGPLGSTGATPIINEPEVALISFHKTQKRPVVRGDNDDIVVRRMMNLSLSFDHRVADGAEAIEFTNCFIKYIENPYLLFVDDM